MKTDLRHVNRRRLPVLSSDLNASRMEERAQFIQTLCTVYGSTNIRVQPEVTLPRLIDVDERDGHYSNTTLIHTCTVGGIHTYGTKYLRANGWTTSMANPSESILHRVTLFITS